MAVRIGRKAEFDQGFLDELIRHDHPEEVGRPAGPQNHLFQLPRLGINVDEIPGYPAPEGAEKRGRHGRRLGCESDVRAPLEPVAGVGLNLQGFPGPADRGRVEDGAFDEDVRGRVLDPGLFPADHAGQGDRPPRVGDDEHVRPQSPVFAVQGPERFAFLGPPDHHPRPLDLGQVEHVDRMAGGEQNDVPDVNDVVDRLEPHGLDFLPDPVGRGADLDALDDIPGVPGTEVLVQNLHFDKLRGFGRKLDDGMDPLLEGAPHEDGDFPGDPEVAEGVGPVGVCLDVEDRVAVGRFRPLLADKADPGQAVEKVGARNFEVDKFFEPSQTDFHLRWNCRLNRRSLS